MIKKKIGVWLSVLILGMTVFLNSLNTVMAFSSSAGDDISIDIPEPELELSGIQFEDSAGSELDNLADEIGKISFLTGSEMTMNGRSVPLYLGEALEESMQGGQWNAVSQDLTQTLGSRQLSAPIDMEFSGVPFTVRLINPYEKDAPMTDCFLIYFSCDSDQAAYSSFGSELQIGSAVREDMQENLLKTAYQDTDGKLVFKIFPSLKFGNMDPDRPYGEQLLKIEDFSMELIFVFGDDGILSTIEMQEPAYLFQGLEDNVSADQAAELTEEQVISATSLRDDILGQLSQAFQEAGVDVNIDQKKGTIRMANEVLFAVNEYELSDAGKDYVDRFIGVYADVILGEEFADQIEKIEISGHTDTDGTFEDNQELSDNRANSVYQYCLSSTTNGMDDIQRTAFEKLVKARGYSFSDPIFTKDGEVDKDASRRVEIKFFIKVGE